MGRARASVGGSPVVGPALWRVNGAQPLFVFDLTQQSAGAATIPTGMAFTRASSGHSVQDGDNLVVVGGAIASNNVARSGRLATAHNYAVFIEAAATNDYGYSRTPGSASGTAGSAGTYTTGRTGPDGTTNATRVQVASGAFARYHTLGAKTGTYCLSAWVKAGLGSGSYQLVAPHTTTLGCAVGGTAGAAWTRTAGGIFTYAAQAPNIVSADGRDFTGQTLGVVAGARDCDLDLIQFELGKHRSSAIITSGGSSATRAAERLTISSTYAQRALVNGRMAVYLRMRMIAGTSELNSSEGWLLYWSTSGGGGWFVDPANRYLYGYNATPDSQTANSAISLTANDLVEWVLEFGGGASSVRWKVNAGSTNAASFTVQNDSWAALDMSGGLDVCNDGGGGQMPCVLENISFFVPGRTPF